MLCLTFSGRKLSPTFWLSWYEAIFPISGAAKKKNTNFASRTQIIFFFSCILLATFLLIFGQCGKTLDAFTWVQAPKLLPLLQVVTAGFAKKTASLQPPPVFLLLQTVHLMEALKSPPP